MEKKVSEWFSAEVITKRYGSSILWTIAVQTLVVVAALLCTSFFFHAQGGSRPSFLTALTHYLILIILTILFAFLHIKNFTVVPRNSLSVLEAGRMWLDPHHWISIIIITILSILYVKCLASLTCSIHYYEDTVMCTTASLNCCLNEKHLFIVLHGAFVGIIFGFHYFSKHWYCLDFPSIEQLKFPTSKVKIKEVIQHSVVTIFRHLRWFYAFYYLFGPFATSIAGAMAENVFCTRIPLSSLRGLLDIHLLWTAWMSSVVLHISWLSFIALFQIFMTEHYQFEIEAVFEKDAHKTLNSVVQNTNVPVMQYLAFHDFSHLSRHSAVRRAKLFDISNPGGHPIQWNAISSHCLKLVETFLALLTDLSSNVTSATTAHKQEELKKTPIKQSVRDASIIGNYPSPSPSSPLMHKRSFVKNLASPDRIPNDTFSERPLLYTSYISVQPSLFSSITQWGSSKVTQVTLKVKQEPIVKYFITESLEAKTERIFLTSQPVIWAVQGLCCMVRASFYEDKYGVVQRVLPEIITKLLDLQTALDRSQKTLTKKQNQQKKGAQLRQTLRVILSTGLYAIVCTFQQHLG